MKEMPITRRTILAGATLIPLTAIRRAEAQTPTPLAPAMNPAMNMEQRKILDAFIDRIIPKDELGPGAVECGVGDYIERCLADYLAAEKPLFLEGLANLDVFALRTQGVAFASLTADKQDAVLMAIDNSQAPNLRGFSIARAASHSKACSATRYTAATRTSPAGTSSVILAQSSPWVLRTRA